MTHNSNNRDARRKYQKAHKALTNSIFKTAVAELNIYLFIYIYLFISFCIQFLSSRIACQREFFSQRAENAFSKTA